MSKTYSYTTEATTANRMAKAFLALQFSQTKVRILYGLIIAAILANLFAFSGQAVFITVILMVFAVLFPVLTYRNAKRAFDIFAAPGAVMSASFTDDTLKIGTAKGTSEIKYDTFEKVVNRDGFVMLKQRGSAIWTVLPKELFPDSALETFARHTK